MLNPSVSDLKEKAAIQEQLQPLSALPVCNKEASRVELVYPIEESKSTIITNVFL